MPEDVNPFDAFETAAPLIAFIHKKLGAEAAREMLKAIVETDPPATAEWLESIAAELAALGLKGVAALVNEATQEAPCEADL